MFSSQKTIVSIDLKGMIASGGRAPLNIDNLNTLFGKLRKMKIVFSHFFRKKQFFELFLRNQKTIENVYFSPIFRACS